MIMRFGLCSLRILKEYMSKNRAYQDHYSLDSGVFLLLRKLMNSNRTIAAIIITDPGFARPPSLSNKYLREFETESRSEWHSYRKYWSVFRAGCEHIRSDPPCAPFQKCIIY